MSDNLPKLKCAGCNKNLLEFRFSETSKRKYRDSLAKNQRNPKAIIKYPRCLNCAVGNVSELTCCMCDRTMELERFSKAQRKKPDDAHCLNCQQEKDDREANFEDEVEEQKILADAASRLNLSGSSSGYSSVHSQSQGSMASFMEDEQSYAASDTGSQTSSRSGTAASWDWNRGNAEIPLSSVASKQTSAEARFSYAGSNKQDPARSSTSSITSKGGNAGFARQGAVVKSAQERADATRVRNQNWQQLHEHEQEEEELAFERDDSDDDSDGDAPY